MTLVSRDLPSGTVTLLFTDIEGSTRLLDELGDSYAEVLAEHRRAVRHAFAHHRGAEVDTQGDAFFYAFARASDAIAAASEAQDALANGPVRVRMGLHTGEPQLTEEGYVGIEVHRAARIAAAGHGGQLLVSQATRELLGTDLELRDLGQHRLKDLSQPVRLFQLGADEFPPLRSLNQTNLPIAATPLVGRSRELAELLELLGRDDVRLVTMTGAGGTGKTRLALDVAAEVVDAFRDGVWFVSLAALRDPELVPSTVAQALGLKEPRKIEDYLLQRRLLLVLDNFEQLLDGAALLAMLLREAAELKLLVTSRAPLRLSGEQEYPVPPLSDEAAVQLFIERARALKPDFEADDSVASICQRLDNLPLALELAAARVKILSNQELLARLEHRLPLLTGGPRDLPEKHQTMRATIEWSYDLLTSDEQELFARLAVFADGCTLESAERVAWADLGGVQSLVERNLIRHAGNRFFMLETIREYALERLNESDDHADARRRHADHFLLLGERSAQASGVSDQAAWLEQLEADRGNFRLALEWYGEYGEFDEQLRLAIALARFWRMRGPIEEGRAWLARALARSGEADPALNAEGLGWAASLARRQGDHTAARAHAEQALALYEAAGDEKGTAQALIDLGCALAGVGASEEARPLLERSVQLSRLADQPATLARALANSGFVETAEGNSELAYNLLEESLTISRGIGDTPGTAFALIGLGEIARDQGDTTDAMRLFREALALSAKLRAREEAAACLEEIAPILQRRGDAQLAATILGAAEVLCEEVGLTLSPHPLDAEQWEKVLSDVRASLDDHQFRAAWQEGRAMAFDQAIRFALDATALRR